MEIVGVRELKENLSRYLKKIKGGEGVIVTERKRRVAILLPFQTEENEKEQLVHLVRRGIVRWSGGRPKGLKRRILVAGKRVSEAVLEDRR
jgi:antitoxin (DNA-binding transcriptional repressor) of toxin-antitoxin stability system